MRNPTAATILLLIATSVSWGGEMHPEFTMRDDQGAPALSPGQEISADATCGKCHDTNFIRSHNSHAQKGVEIDCFGCHLPDGLTAREEDYFTDAVELNLLISPPTSRICGQCHGYTQDLTSSVEIDSLYLLGDEQGIFGSTLRTGEIFSGQQMVNSYLNLAHKSSQIRPWDVHAARELECTSCHFTGNNPGKTHLLPGQGVPHLIHDPRTPSIEEFLTRPDHLLTSIECTGCHDPGTSHPDLPYMERHIAALACQACHVPSLMAPTMQAVDRTVVTRSGGPRLEIRGIDHREWEHPGTWFNRGYLPFLLLETEKDRNRFAPYNLVTSWQWVTGKDNLPLDRTLLQRAWLDENGAYHPDLLPLFDADGNGDLEPEELILDNGAKTDFIQGKLISLGADNPRITARIEAHPLRHGIASGEHSTSDCATCHEADSRFNEDILLARGPFPGGVTPVIDPPLARMIGEKRITTTEGELKLTGNLEAGDHYIFGNSTRPWIDKVGLLFLLLTAAGVALHSGMRVLSARERGPVTHEVPMKRVYMYSQYERVWHWVMALSIILLLLTGFQIHFPGHINVIKFATAILLHNIMAGVLIINSFLSLFFHLATAEIKQFVPERTGLIKRLMIQGRYYLQGIFQGAAHPIRKTPEYKLNPLQQLTYAGLLNFLFPLQILTGILLWVGGLMPAMLVPVGGLAILAPVHNLGSWLFLSFLVVHVYLTTTGHTVTSNLQAMVDGWEYIESETEVKS